LIASGQFNYALSDRGSDCHLVISDLECDLLNEIIRSTNSAVSKHPDRFALQDPASQPLFD
jgi:hypothetical protein